MALAAAGVAAVALLAAGPTAPARGDVVAHPFAKPSAARISAVRVCSQESFDQGACLRDERILPLLSRSVSCSARVEVVRATRIAVRFRYEGALALSFSRAVPRGVYRVSVTVALPGVEMPGGSYRCEFVAGAARGGVSFRSAGPFDPLLAPSVCAGVRAAQPAGAPCEADESGAPLVAPASVTCSAAYARQQGRRFGIELLARDGDASRSLHRYDETVPSPLGAGFSALTLPAGQVFPAGEYVCRFFLDEQLVVEKPFTVAAPSLALARRR